MKIALALEDYFKDFIPDSWICSGSDGITINLGEKFVRILALEDFTVQYWIDDNPSVATMGWSKVKETQHPFNDPNSIGSLMELIEVFFNGE